MDREIYANTMLSVLEGTSDHFQNKEIVKNLSIYEASVSTLHIENGECKGVVLNNGEILKAKNVVLTTGTFLGAKVHIGSDSQEAGRYRRNGDQLEPPSNEMAKCIRNLGFPVDRLRTGTPPRLSLKSIDFSGMDKQISDNPPQLFSYLHEFNGFKPEN